VSPDRPAETTVELLALARDGDRRAVDRLFERYLPRLRRWASGRLPAWARSAFDTDDVVQDVLYRSIQRVSSFENQENAGFHSYLRQAVLNRVRDEVRRAQHGPAFRELSGDAAGREASPLEIAIGNDEAERYEKALQTLSTLDRELVIARLEMGLGYDEIAEALGKPSRNAARMSVVRALERLTRMLSGDA
jgi:RNA polymerase sigma factor (sigma-70 family)